MELGKGVDICKSCSEQRAGYCKTFFNSVGQGFSGSLNGNCFPFYVKSAMSAVRRQSRDKMRRRQETKPRYFQVGVLASAVIDLEESCYN